MKQVVASVEQLVSTNVVFLRSGKTGEENEENVRVLGNNAIPSARGLSRE